TLAPAARTAVAPVRGAVGLCLGFHPPLWLGLFSDDPDVFRIGGLYLHIVAPTYLCFGMGLGLFFVSQGLGRSSAAAAANGVRLALDVVCGLGAGYLLRPRLVGVLSSGPA